MCIRDRLSSVVTALGRGGDRLRLFVGSDGSGCLDEAGIETTRYWYRRMPYRLLTLITYMGSQLSLLTLLFRSRDIDRKALIYVNTLLPFGAALYGWMTRRPVDVYKRHLEDALVADIVQVAQLHVDETSWPEAGVLLWY